MSADDGVVISGLSKDIVVTKAVAAASSIPMTYTLAVKTQVGTLGNERNKLVPLIHKGTALPAEGRQSFRAAKTLNGGTPDVLHIEFFDMVAGINDPEKSLHIGDFRLDAEIDLVKGERIAFGSEMIIHWTMSDNGTLNFAVEIPDIAKVIDARNFYFAESGHVNFEGEQGSQVATALLAQAKQELNELIAAIPNASEQTNALQNRAESQHTALATSVDADVHRSVSEEARKIRQDVRLLKTNPKNVEHVLTRDLEEAEAAFDELRDDLERSIIEKYDQLILSARRSLRERVFEASQVAFDEMRSIRFKTLATQPEFLVELFKQIASGAYLAVNPNLHDELISAGIERINANGVDGLKAVIRQIFDNRVSVGASGAGPPSLTVVKTIV